MMTKPNREDYKIDLTVSIKETIFGYFKHARYAVENNKEYLKRHRELDFLKMRRFLNTTYKTLTEIDPEFMAHKLSGIYKRLNTLADVYDDFVRKSKVGVHSYEAIFLYQQSNFSAYAGRLDHNGEEISFLRVQTQRYKESVEEQKEKLAKASKITGDYAKQEEELKRLKRQENASIVRLGFLLEENLILSEVIRDFRDLYEDEFVLTFTRFVKNIKPHLLSILNALAFEFDIELWHKAKDSEIITNYFKNAYMGAVVNSKMYLSYFLRNLDPMKMSKENKELQKLLDYLNESNPVHVVMYLPDVHDLQVFKSALESDNSGFVVHAFTDARVALSSAFEKRIHLLIIDMDIQDNILKSFIESYRTTMRRLQTHAKIIGVTSDVHEGTIEKAEALGMDSLIEREEDAVEIIDAVYEMLKVDISGY